MSIEGKEPTGWYFYKCHKCRGEWKSLKGEADMLMIYEKSPHLYDDETLGDFRGEFMGFKPCPVCGEDADEVMCRVEYCEPSDWRKRYPRLPAGVTAKWITPKGCPVRFRAHFKSKYLGTFAFIHEAEEAVADAKKEWEERTKPKGVKR